MFVHDSYVAFLFQVGHLTLGEQPRTLPGMRMRSYWSVLFCNTECNIISYTKYCVITERMVFSKQVCMGVE